MTLSKPEARIACNQMNLLEGSIAEMIEKIGHALLDQNSANDDRCVLCIDQEDNSNDDDNCLF